MVVPVHNYVSQIWDLELARRFIAKHFGPPLSDWRWLKWEGKLEENKECPLILLI